MVRNKKTVGSSKKHPMVRRNRKVSTGRKVRPSAPGGGLTKARSRPTREAASKSRDADVSEAYGRSEAPTAQRKPAQRVEASREANSSRPTDRPVARSIKPAAREPERKKQGGVSGLWLAAAAALLGGALWVGLSDSESSSEAASVAQVVPAQQPADEAAAGIDEPQGVPELEQTAAAGEELVAELEPTEPVETTAKPRALQRVSNRRRVLSAKASPEPDALPEQDPAVAQFQATAADAALSSAASQASACRQDGDPTGVARVVVTFAPSGRVTSATINGPPFAGTETGSCIAKAMRSMQLPAFTGEHVTLSKTVVIM